MNGVLKSVVSIACLRYTRDDGADRSFKDENRLCQRSLAGEQMFGTSEEGWGGKKWKCKRREGCWGGLRVMVRVRVRVRVAWELGRLFQGGLGTGTAVTTTRRE
jgi:hypothetical protein